MKRFYINVLTEHFFDVEKNMEGVFVEVSENRGNTATVSREVYQNLELGIYGVAQRKIEELDNIIQQLKNANEEKDYIIQQQKIEIEKPHIRPLVVISLMFRNAFFF